jgi:hypothetical protein
VFRRFVVRIQLLQEITLKSSGFFVDFLDDNSYWGGAGSGCVRQMGGVCGLQNVIQFDSVYMRFLYSFGSRAQVLYSVRYK